MCIKYGYCKDLFECLTNLKDMDVDPLKQIKTHKLPSEDLHGQTNGPSNSGEDEDIILDKLLSIRSCQQSLCFLTNIKKMHKNISINVHHAFITSPFSNKLPLF